MSTFDIDGFGSFCLPEGKDYATCMINFTKGTSPLYPRYVPCSFSFFFDCTGILWDDEVPIPVSEPCTPDCPQAAWTKENGTFHGYVNGVIVDVSYEYYWRKGCGYQDIQVTDFVYSLDYGSPVGKDAIFAKIIRDIMYKNEMDFDPKASQILDPFVLCDATWRVTMGSCFSERYFHLSTWPFQPLLNAIALDDSTGGSGTSSTGFELGSLITSHLELYPLTPLKLLVAKHKCADVDCCTQQMEVCRNSNGISSITNIPPTDSYVECEGIYDAYTNPFTQKSYSLPCQPVCDWLDEVPGLFNTKIMIDEQHNDLAIAQYNLKDFYANEQIQISFNSTVQANIEVNVYDITGSFIATEKGSFGAGDSQLTINTNDFKTGTYYYIIVINNMLIKSNKFVIVR